MNKQQFMFTLSQGLEPLGRPAVNDILADFEDHFRNGMQAGLAEDRIADELGNPAEIARQYLDETSPVLLKEKAPALDKIKQIVDAPAQPGDSGTLSQPAATPAVQAPHVEKTGNDATLVAVILFNIFIGVPIWIALFAVLSGFWAAAAGIGATACILFALAIFETGITSVILVLFGLAQTALTTLSVILMVYLTKWLISGLRAYIRWSRKLIRGGVPA